jgi:hypothetical protein
MPLYSQEPYTHNQESFGFNSGHPESSPLEYPEHTDPEFVEKFQELPDGSALFVVGDSEGGDEPLADNGYFDDNLAEFLDESTLSTLSAELIEEIEADKESRQEWESSVNTIIKYLGWRIEEYKDKLCSAYDSTLSMTLFNVFAILKSELFPSSGPAKGQVSGNPTEDAIEQSERAAIFVNYFLTIMDKPYYPDKERLLIYACLLGSAFSKIVMDPSTGRPSARLVKPQDLIINNECTSVLESSRITHLIKISKKEILLRERDGIYVKGVIKNYENDSEESSNIDTTISKIDGINKSKQKNKFIFDFYECHVELDPKKLKDNYFPINDDVTETVDGQENIPRPYIVTICKDTKKIASITRNWDEPDNKFKRIECFVHYYFLPGMGLYGLGIGHVIGSNSVVLTNMLRQSLDSAFFANFPGGFIDENAQQDKNNYNILPGVFVPIKTDGKAIGEMFQALPFRDTSPTAIQLRQELKGDTANLGGAAQQAEPMGNSNAPVGTTLAQIEVNDRLPTNILKSFITSYGYELQMIKSLFGKNLNKPFSFSVPGNNYQITMDDFNDNVNIIPVADPNLSSKSQRIIINEILIRVARENPGVVDLREAISRLFKSMNVEDIDKLLPKPQEPQEIVPLDPVTENMNIINGKGAKAGIEQDDDAHIMSHSMLMQIPAVAQDQQKMAVTQAHISEHQANKYLKQIQMAMGMQMPDPQALQDPQMQNQVAMMAAQATQQMQQEQQAQNPPPLDPNAVMLQDIEQRREASHLKLEEAQLRAETEAFKTQTQFESGKVKMELEKKLAKDKNETSLTIARMKQKDTWE